MTEDAKRARRRSPPEAKRLSLQRDRRNGYGENDKASRKAIPRFKAKSNCTGRHGVKQALSSAGACYDEAAEKQLLAASHKAEKPYKTKCADAALKDAIAWSQRRRDWHAERKKP